MPQRARTGRRPARRAGGMGRRERRTVLRPPPGPEPRDGAHAPERPQRSRPKAGWAGLRRRKPCFRRSFATGCADAGPPGAESGGWLPGARPEPTLQRERPRRAMSCACRAGVTTRAHDDQARHPQRPDPPLALRRHEESWQCARIATERLPARGAGFAEIRARDARARRRDVTGGPAPVVSVPRAARGARPADRRPRLTAGPSGPAGTPS